MEWKAFEISVVVLHPLLMGALVRLAGGKMDKSGDQAIVNTVPPGWVFGVVWPILFTCIGLAWAYAGTGVGAVFIYVLLDLSLIAWAPLFNRFSKRYAMYMLHLSIMFCLIAFTHGPTESQYFIAPLLAWLLLASKLNYTIALNLGDATTTESNFSPF